MPTLLMEKISVPRQAQAKIAANLIINELLPRLKRKGLKIESSPVTPAHINLMARFKHAGFLSTHSIRILMDDLISEAQ